MNMKWIIRLGSLLLLFFVVFLFLKLKPVWLPVLDIILKAMIPFGIATFVSYLLFPVVETLNRKGIKRSWAILLIYLLFFGGLTLALYKGIPIVIGEVEGLLTSTPEVAGHYNAILDWIGEKTAGWPMEIQDRVGKGIHFFESKAETFLLGLMASLVKLLDFVMVFAIIPLISFYFLKDWELIKKAAWYITPSSIRKPASAFLHDVEQSLGDYLRGQLLVCLIVGCVSALLLWLLGIKFSLLLGLFIGVTNVIPYFGPVIGAVPAVIVAAATSAHQVLWVVVIVFGLQFMEGNILSPLIVGKSLHMHPLLIMLALFLGGEVGGVAGLVLAVPILSFLKVSVIHAKVHFMQERQRKLMKQQESE